MCLYIFPTNIKIIRSTLVVGFLNLTLDQLRPISVYARYRSIMKTYGKNETCDKNKKKLAADGHIGN